MTETYNMTETTHRDFANVPVMWEPEDVSGRKVKEFVNIIERKYKIKLKDYWEFHQWSIDNLPKFWEEFWDFVGIIYSKRHHKVIDLSIPMYEPLEWFEGARLNFAENLLKYRDDHVAMIVTGEDRDTEKVTYAEMYEESKLYAAALRKCGIKKGDRVSSPTYKKACIKFAEKHLKRQSNWSKIIFTDEKKFSSTGPDDHIHIEALLLRVKGIILKSQQNILAVRTAFSSGGFMSNRKEAILAMLGTTSIGAIWLGALPLMGSQAVLNRFKQVQPKILFTVDRFSYDREEKEMLSKAKEIADGLSSLEKVVIVPSKPESKLKDISNIRNSCFLDDFLEIGKNPDGKVPEMSFEQVSFTHPVFISYTSGTTGLPKVLVHGCGVLLSCCRDFWLHGDGDRDRCLLSTSAVGWASWNMCVSMFSLGMTVVVFEGIPYFLSPTFLWDIIDEFQISNLFLAPSVLDDLEKKGYLPTERNHLSSLKVITSGGSVVKPQNFDFVYKKIKTDVLFSSAYGSTELMGSCIILDQTLKIYRGEITAPSLAIDISCVDDEGKPVLGEIGELVINKPTPSLPLGFWGDTDRSIFKKTYFEKYPGKFAVGDLAIINPYTKGIIICGRSDDTLKPKGCRFGSSEIYNIVDTFPEVQDSLCVSQYNKKGDERAVLFLKMRNGHLFNENIVKRIRAAIERELSDRHIPEVILETPDIPHNMNGKKMEIVVKKIINKMPYNPETVINPECLQNFEDVPQLRGF